MSVILDRLDVLAKQLKQKNASDGEVAAILKRIVHSPTLALVVKLTPNPVDDAVLDILKAIVPAP